MKTGFLFLLVILSGTTALVAQSSSFERELEQLLKQRDAAIEAALAPINDKFKTAAEQILRRATQANDLRAAQKVTEAIEAGETPEVEPVKDLRKHISGTKWNAEDPASLRPGLAESLVFTDETVEPGGYRYEVSSSRTLTIVFPGGDRQVMTLTKGGKQLELEFQQRKIVYLIEP